MSVFRRKLIQGNSITLPYSKSILNRTLLIDFLYNQFSEKYNPELLCDDVLVMQQALSDIKNEKDWIDVKESGTAFRFLTAAIALTGRNIYITGNDSLLSRPIQPLLDCLSRAGAIFEWKKIHNRKALYIKGTQYPVSDIDIEAVESSQYISALMIAAPYYSNDVTLCTKGVRSSAPYIELTRHILEKAGFIISDNQLEIRVIRPQKIKNNFFSGEGDWTAASYWFILVSGSEKGTGIHIKGLTERSWQGDACVSKLFNRFGVNTQYKQDGIYIEKTALPYTESCFFSMHGNPDLIPSIAVAAIINRICVIIDGIETLAFKESNREKLLVTQLSQFCNIVSDGKKIIIQGPFAEVNDQIYILHTENDHRMSMAFTCLSLRYQIDIPMPGGVSKSYPNWWEQFNIYTHPV